VRIALIGPIGAGKSTVADILAEELGRDAAWRQAQIAAYRALADGYVLD